MLSLVVPTYNEKDNVEKLVEEIGKVLKKEKYEIIFIDVSSDGTDKILDKIISKNKQVRYEHNLKLKGISKQVIRGFEISKGDILAVMDADLQHPPYLLEPMLKEMENADIVIPSRFIKGGSDGGLNLYRKLVSFVARQIGKIYLPNLRKISDLSSGIFMFKKDILNEKIKLNPIGWKIMLEVLEKSNYKKIIEIPYKFQPRNSGSSKMNKKVMKEYIEQLRILKKERIINNYKVERKYNYLSKKV